MWKLFITKPQSDVFKLLILSTQHSKTQRLINDKDKHQILTFKKQKQANVWHFWLENDILLIIKIDADSFPFDQLII